MLLISRSLGKSQALKTLTLLSKATIRKNPICISIKKRRHYKCLRFYLLFWLKFLRDYSTSTCTKSPALM